MLEKQVESPSLRAALTPDYNYTCKRPTISNEYYAMFNRPNVELISDSIAGIEAGGIRTQGGRLWLCDVLVLATGFQAFDITKQIELRGRGGVSLAEIWERETLTYKSVMAANMPNLFFLHGPNSGALTSAIQVIESGAAFVSQALLYMQKEGLVEVEPRKEWIDSFRTEILDRFSKTTQNKGCRSWWTNDNGFPHASWPGSSISYRALLQHLSPRELTFSSKP
jgi:cation diffusion facilitator CzcD-associated flavoprotein CzcO